VTTWQILIYSTVNPDLDPGPDATIEQSYNQCCGDEIIPFGSGSVESKLRIAAPAPALDSFIRYIENYHN
jgi:hypothetical protein